MKAINEVLWSIFNSYGFFIYNTFETLFILIGFILIILIIVFYIMKKKGTKIKKIVIVNALLFCFLLIIMVLPFIRGSEINRIIINGTKIIDCINEFKKHHGDYPREISQINSVCKNLEDSESFTNSYQYLFIDSNIINEKNKNDKGFKKLNQNSYRFYIISEVLKPDRMFYNERLSKFMLID